MDLHNELKARRAIKIELDSYHKTDHGTARAAREKAKKLKRELKLERKREQDHRKAA